MISRVVLFTVGITLMLIVLLPSLAGPVRAAPLTLITEVPTAEPPTRTPTDTPPTNTPIPASSAVPTNTPIPASSAVPTNTPIPAGSAVPTSTPIPAGSAVPTNTPVPAGSAVPTNTPVPAGSAVPTNTPIPAGSAVPTNTPIPAGSAVPTNTPVPAGSAVPTNTPVPAGSAVPTNTPIPVGSAVPTNTPIPVGSAVPTNTPISTDIPTRVSSSGGTHNPTETPTPTNTPVPQAADLSITKSVNRSTVAVGDSVEFTIRVTNIGNATAHHVVAEDSLPSFLALIGTSATRGDVSVSGTTVRVTIGDLAPGETATLTITARVVATAMPPDNINGATVSSDSLTDNLGNNSSVVSLITDAQPSPTAAIPTLLPNTGTPNDSATWLLVALGVGLIAASLLTRWQKA